MWKLFNELFGWEYVLFNAYQNTTDWKIKRVYKTPKGQRYIKRDMGEVLIIDNLVHKNVQWVTDKNDE